MPPRIPQRNPIGDPFEGVLLRVEDASLLAQALQPGTTRQASGPFIIRYGIEYLGKPQFSIVPGIVAADYGDMYTGNAAWEFVFQKSNLYPRADVIGYRNDGQDDMVPLKFLDLVRPVHVLVYEDEQAARPIARVSALIAADTTGIAARILEYLAVYPSVASWQEDQKESE